MKLLVALITPWLLFFTAALAGITALTLESPKLPMPPQQFEGILLITGTIFCLFSNSSSIRKAGIWLAEALPESLRYSTGRWIFAAIKAGLVAGAIWVVGQFPWTPLIWQGAILPLGISICLFVVVWHLLGTILRWSINVPWSRAFSMIVSFPVLTLVPLTAFYLHKSVVFSYRASHADPAIAFDDIRPETTHASVSPGKLEPQKVANTKSKVAEPLPEPDIEKLLRSRDSDDRARALQALTLIPKLCAEHSKEVQAALDPHGAKDVVLWAIRASKCADIRTVVGLPRLVQIMTEHQDPETRAAAIRGMRRYGDENVRQVAYLLVKRLSEKEPPEVIEATAAVLAQLGVEQQKWATHRLKGLLDIKNASEPAAKALIENYQNVDTVVEYVASHISSSGEARDRAIGMICLLPPEKRTVSDADIGNIVAAVKSVDSEDRSLAALRCLGQKGFQAIRDELESPKRLDRLIAAHAFAEIDSKGAPEALKTASSCARDPNEQVRRWCSQTLGQIGAPALPKILELLKSSDGLLKASGQNALLHFDDPRAKPELKKILEENTGWMANSKKLQVAKAIGTALNRIETKTQ